MDDKQPIRLIDAWKRWQDRSEDSEDRRAAAAARLKAFADAYLEGRRDAKYD